MISYLIIIYQTSFKIILFAENQCYLAEGVLVNLVRKNKIGFTSKPGNIIKLVNNIIRIMNLSKKVKINF